jgi:hypothetical protein
VYTYIYVRVCVSAARRVDDAECDGTEITLVCVMVTRNRTNRFVLSEVVYHHHTYTVHHTHTHTHTLHTHTHTPFIHSYTHPSHTHIGKASAVGTIKSLAQETFTQLKSQLKAMAKQTSQPMPSLSAADALYSSLSRCTSLMSGALKRTHTHIYTLSHSLTHSHILSLSISLSLTHSLTYTLSLYLSLSHTHTFTHTRTHRQLHPGLQEHSRHGQGVQPPDGSVQGYVYMYMCVCVCVNLHHRYFLFFSLSHTHSYTSLFIHSHPQSTTHTHTHHITCKHLHAHSHNIPLTHKHTHSHTHTLTYSHTLRRRAHTQDRPGVQRYLQRPGRILHLRGLLVQKRA